MRKSIFSMAVGVTAGVVDILPMITQKMDMYSIASAFVQWLVLGFVIINMPSRLKGWLKGPLLSLLLAAPIMILVAKSDLKSVIPIMAMSCVLGVAVGWAGEKLGS